MQTSGTTSGEVVPLITRRYSPARQFPLVADDRALSVTPLFTKGALGVDLFAPIAAGASTVITPGFSATEFVGWLDEFRPTFYSASPTIQAAILEALQQRKPAAPCSLRYARSSSTALPQTIQCRLEAALGVPVIQGYGMTESGLIAQGVERMARDSRHIGFRVSPTERRHRRQSRVALGGTVAPGGRRSSGARSQRDERLRGQR
jgi:acyl-CoA synthetase (AMP-forming)/AMP-acid ligase II